MTMSWVGLMIGLPLAGLKMLLVDIISVMASTWASIDSGRCTAIWSPSKSALNPLQTSGWMRIALPSTSTGSNAWMPMRCRVGARLSRTGWLRMTSSRMSQTSSLLPLEHLLGRLDRVGVAQLLEPADDERLEQLQGDLLGQAALVQLQVRADDDHRAGRVIDALAQQVLAEPALLALDHVGQRLERAVRSCRAPGRLQRLLSNRASTACWSIRFSLRMMTSGAFRSTSFLRPVVAVDDPAVEVVQVAGGEVARVEQDQRPQVRRDDRDAFQDHPLGAVVAVAQRLDDLEPLGQVLDLLLAAGLDQLLAQLLGQADQVEPHEQLADGLGAHVGLEAVAVLLAWPCGTPPRSGAAAP